MKRILKLKKIAKKEFRYHHTAYMKIVNYFYELNYIGQKLIQFSIYFGEG